jgi:hypothetical protein
MVSPLERPYLPANDEIISCMISFSCPDHDEQKKKPSIYSFQGGGHGEAGKRNFSRKFTMPSSASF